MDTGETVVDTQGLLQCHHIGSYYNIRNIIIQDILVQIDL
jgi:hypothetical protein